MAYINLPLAISEETVIINPKTLAPCLYEFVLPQRAQYINNMALLCHPLVQGYNARLSINDISHIYLVIDGEYRVALQNYDTSEPSIMSLSALYYKQFSFFQGLPLITEALYKTPATLQVVTWREPQTPFWLQTTLYYTMHPQELRLCPITMPTPVGLCYYSNGILI